MTMLRLRQQPSRWKVDPPGSNLVLRRLTCDRASNLSMWVWPRTYGLGGVQGLKMATTDRNNNGCSKPHCIQHTNTWKSFQSLKIHPCPWKIKKKKEKKKRDLNWFILCDVWFIMCRVWFRLCDFLIYSVMFDSYCVVFDLDCVSLDLICINWRVGHLKSISQTFYGLSFSEPKRRRGTFFLNFHMWPQFNFQIFRCGLSLDETKRRIESMVIFYIYHTTNK